MTKTNNAIPTNATELLNTVKRANVIKTWPGEYRIYAEDAIVFVYFDARGTLTHFSTTFTKNGLNRIEIPAADRENLSKAILEKVASLYNITTAQAIELKNSRNK